MTKNLIIAIDGYSSTGKSSLSKIIAKELGYTHIDSGAMYRAVTLFALENKLIKEEVINKIELIKLLPTITLNFILNKEKNKNEIYLNGINVEDKIRDLNVSSYVSPIAEIPEIRDFCVAQQRKIGENKNIVMDGRDIGTTVFPFADFKFFITASPEMRAKRRFLEYQEEGKNVSFDEVLSNVIKRDNIDSSRAYSPLKQAEDAIVVDNTDLNLEQTVNYVLNIIKDKMA